MKNRLVNATTGRWLSGAVLVLALVGCQSAPPVATGPNVEQLQKQAVSAQRMGQYNTALKAYLELLDAQPDNLEYLYQIGQIQAQLGKNDHAITAFQDVLKVQPDHLPAMTSLALLHMARGDNGQARTYLDKAIRLDQKRLYAEDTSIQVQLGESGTQPWHALDERSPLKAYQALGILRDLDADFDGAQALYRLVLTLQPSNAKALNNLGYSYYLAGDLIRAETYLRRATQRQPEFLRAWTNLGLVYVRQGQSERAFQAFRRVMPEADAYNDIGYFVMLEGQLKEAERLFIKAIDASPIYFATAQDNLRAVQQLQLRTRVADSDAVREAVIKARFQSGGFSQSHSLVGH
ncbi:tetratricopeptide repeat protein [Ferrimonas balearica]|uniref:tetratricopeptide repeat protein n=1 Tax=Ferrimonas balearica TaxID=44012 RepID=UPI001C946AA2|nr:tetratricopeptide repeat protein [Ferrimonas balearica]MBY5980661.1 tetratricopeptide repeat protein [Ferrimonas balearica]